MTTSNKLNEIVETLVNDSNNGVTMKNIKRGLELKNLHSVLVEKLMRLLELQLIIKGC